MAAVPGAGWLSAGWGAAKGLYGGLSPGYRALANVGIGLGAMGMGGAVVGGISPWGTAGAGAGSVLGWGLGGLAAGAGIGVGRAWYMTRKMTMPTVRAGLMRKLGVRGGVTGLMVGTGIGLLGALRSNRGVNRIRGLHQ